LLDDVPMSVAGSLQLPKQAPALGLAPGAVLVQVFPGLRRPGRHGMAPREERPFGFAPQFDEDCALATALATKAAHDLV
jgi:hypothetical protein